MIKRLVNVRFLSQTECRPHRYTLRTAGHPAKTCGIHGYTDEAAAVRVYLNTMEVCGRYPYIVEAVEKMANPLENGDSLYLVTINEVAR